MEKVLSQDEVNALLHGLDGDDGDDAQEHAAPVLDEASGVVPYALGTNDSVNWGHLPSLQMICEKWARAIQEHLSSVLLEEVVVSLDDFIYKPFQDFVDTLLMPSSFTICRLAPLQGSGILILDAGTVTNMMDLLFGGRNQTHVKIEGRDFSAVERHFINQVSGSALELMREAWEKVHPISFEFQRMEINPQFAMVIGSADMAVCAQFSVELHHQETTMYMVFPYSSLEPIKEKLSSVFKGEEMVADDSWIRSLKSRVQETSLKLEVELGRTKIPLGEVSRWEVGDVLQLTNKVSDPLELKVAGVPKFWGYPGEKDGYVAFQAYGECRADDELTQEEDHG
jgi:flagellar motor switch protein FliM